MPPHNAAPDPNGWYNPAQCQRQSRLQAPNVQNAPQHPPGLSISPRVVDPPSQFESEQVHEHWRGRLAPFPGFSSKSILLPMKGIQLGEDDKEGPETQSPPDSNPELIPPMSFFGPNYRRKSSSKPKAKKTEKKISENTKKEFQLDKYADSFVPQYLKKIQLEIHPLKPLPPIPIFPSPTYLQSFLSSRSISTSLKYNLNLLSSPPTAPNSKPPSLGKETYHQHWKEILQWELDAITVKKEQIVLWKMGVKVVAWKDAEFVLSVPGIRENHPYLEIGDLVHMREVLEAQQKGSGHAVEARVVALRKREGLIHIASQTLREHIQTHVALSPTTKLEDGFAVYGPEDDVPLKFNVSFMMNARALCYMETAVAAVAEFLNDEAPGTNLTRQWIFPEPEDYVKAPSKKMRDAEIKETQWVDSGLNDEQRLAVKSVVLYQSPVPHLISGPPGTGKTRTVVEAVLQIFQVQLDACILLCAPSNPATDTLALRLQKNLLQDEMLRLNDPNRTFAEVPAALTPYCYVENDRFALPPWKKLMSYRVVVCCCLDASILVRAQCSNTALMAMEDEVISTLHPYRKTKYLAQPHWTHLLIDEAAQGSEPELLIPFSVVVPPVIAEKTVAKAFMPQIALCGDINQLGPLISSDEARAAELEVSLLERLFERPLYSDFIEATRKVSINGHGRSTASQRLPPYTRLVKNYRSHPAILMPPSAIFYNDTLEPCAENGKVVWKGLSNPDLPLKFIGDESPEESSDERASWFNPGQINAVVDVIKSLLADPRASNPPLRPAEIGVMAPWRVQVWKLREKLRQEGLSAVDVGTVEVRILLALSPIPGFRNHCIYLPSRTTKVVKAELLFFPAFVQIQDSWKRTIRKGWEWYWSARGGWPFARSFSCLTLKNRMNVAITRAKELLVVIGNGSLLQSDPYWKSFLQFAQRNRLYEGPKLALEMDGNYISRLESRLLLSGKAAAKLDAEERGVVLAASAAREILRE
ncbi:hypothetical protein NLJ89_g7334 [Agrocybe chaxingu]|uniref:RNA helicase n=1 Tax=Agrocybe chaxingu TaxID=84603 RepID=A0A9W8JX12_9AGAR|nr:hypothetical protein NLJ89_g7334 [Agrocybe chaxingu]